MILSLPSDHHAPDRDAFRSLVALSLPAARDGWLVLFGVQPDRASTSYGYIAPGEPIGNGAPGQKVVSFLEKPDAVRAAELLAEGCVWNSGIVLARVDRLLEAYARHAPGLLTACRLAVASAECEARCTLLGSAAVAACPSIAIDRAVLEKDGRIAMLPFVGAWRDLGSWEALGDHIGDGIWPTGGPQPVSAQVLLPQS